MPTSLLAIATKALEENYFFQVPDTEASTFEEPGARKRHAGIRAGAVRATGRPTAMAGIDSMRVTSIRLPKSQQFCVAVRTVKSVFSDFEDLSVHFGSLRKTFTFDSRCYNRRDLQGSVVASLSVPRMGPQILSLYGINRADYSKLAAADFAAVYVHKMSQWLKSKLQR